MNETRKQALPVGTRIGVYEIRRVIGAGRFGITYQAWNQHLNSEMALKEYFPSDIVQRAADGLTLLTSSDRDKRLFQRGLDRFAEDADKLSRIEHTHLERVQNDLQIHGTIYLAMEYEDGVPLSRVVERSGTVLDEEQLKVIFLPVFEALGEVHEAGVIHGDINPENILLRKTGESVLLDFASAKLVLAAPLGIGLKVYSEGYAAVEQFDPQGQIGPWTDLYSLGATIYRCVTGNDPLPATDRASEVAQGKPDPQWPAVEAAASGYHADFLKVVDGMLAIQPEERPQSVASVLETLKAVSEDQAEAGAESVEKTEGESTKSRPVAPRKARPSVPLLIFAGLTAILLVGTGLWFSSRDRSGNEILAVAESQRLASMSRSQDKSKAAEPVSEMGPGGTESGQGIETPAVGLDKEAETELLSYDTITDTIDTREAPDKGSELASSGGETSMAGSSPDTGSSSEIASAQAVGETGEKSGSMLNDEVATNPSHTQERTLTQSDVTALSSPDAGTDADGSFAEGGAPTEESVAEGAGIVSEDNEVGRSTVSEIELNQAKDEYRVSVMDDAPPETSSAVGMEAVSEVDETGQATISETGASVDEAQLGVEAPPPGTQTESVVGLAQQDASPQEGSDAAQADLENVEMRASDSEGAMISIPTIPQGDQVAGSSQRSELDRRSKVVIAPAGEDSETPRTESADAASETLQDELRPDPQKEPTEDVIAVHMAAAEEDIAALRLSTPQGNNALEHYQAVLALNSDHSEAQEGVRRIVNVYVLLIDKALEKEQLVAARVYLDRAEEIMPEAPDLQQARLNLDAVIPAGEVDSAVEPE